MEEQRDEAILVNNGLAFSAPGYSRPDELGVGNRW